MDADVYGPNLPQMLGIDMVLHLNECDHIASAEFPIEGKTACGLAINDRTGSTILRDIDATMGCIGHSL